MHKGDKLTGRSLDEQIEQLKRAIAEIEDQRSILGDEAVEAALVPSRRRLAELESRFEQREPASEETPIHQRKLATILFMDVVGSTELTRGLDPEDQMELIDPLIARLAEKVTEFGGHVARFQGDGFKAVFGLPLARENDPEQAIRAGLTIQAEAAKIAGKLESQHVITDFKVRVGISTGLVFSGGDTEGEDTIKGDAVNLTARLESAARPGELLISHDTYRHVRGVFTVEPQEPITAKGFPEPVPVYLVKELKPRAFRVQTRRVEGVETRMVGRYDELKFLQDALMTAFEEGEGHVVTVSGEAGVGKSRLLYEFQNWLELLPSAQAVWFFQGSGRQESQGSPYSLLRDVFAFRFQISDDDSGEQARNKIENGFREVLDKDEDGEMKAHILGQLLGFDFSASPHLKGVLNDAEQLRNRGVMYLIQYFQELSQELPVVIFLEDIHWGDDSSLDVVSRIGEFTPNYPISIVCACRPQLFESRPYWGEGHEYHKLLELHPLSKRESRQLVTEILKLADDIPIELRELIVKGAEGNPFYTEELIKMLVENGVIIPDEETWQIDLSHLEQVDVPSTLAGVLQARLDSLPIHERTVLQQASVVGRLFWDRIVVYIQAVGGNGGDPALTLHTLVSLRNRELIYRHEESAFVGAVEYLFKHDVLREVTYESVLKRLRKIYHGLVADWLISNCGDRIGEYSGLIAEHLLQAGKDEQACEYFIQAGETALASYANAEAEGYFRRTLDLFPDNRLKADSLQGLGEALFMQGHSEASESTWRQAIDLYKEIGDYDKLGETYASLSLLIWRFMRYSEARKLCQQGLKSFEDAPDSNGYAHLLAEAGRTALITTHKDQGKLLCEQAIDMALRLENLEVQLEATITLAINVTEEIKILEEVAGIAEANGLFRTAGRAHYDIGLIFGGDLTIRDSALKSQHHFLRAVDFFQKICDIEGMLFVLSIVYQSFLDLGELNTVEDEIYRIFGSSIVPKTRLDKLLNINRPLLMSAQGEWSSAIEAIRGILKDFQDEGNIQKVVYRKVSIADEILEQNRFGRCEDLSEAERFLLESIDQDPSFIHSQFSLVILYIRQGRLDDAREQFVRAKENIKKSRPGWVFEDICSRIELEFAFAEKCWEKAVSLCETQIDIYHLIGCSWGWARRLIDLGDALTGRNEPGDLYRARETYQQSLDMFTGMGAPGYVEVLEERLEKLNF